MSFNILPRDGMQRWSRIMEMLFDGYVDVGEGFLTGLGLETNSAI